MDQVYGKVTPFVISMVVTLLTQWVKNNTTLTGRQVQLVALGISMVLTVTFETVTQYPDITPLSVFSSFIYGLMGWFSAIGMYEAATKQLAR